MKRKELIELLKEIAERDITEGSDIYDHPCSVAIRELEKEHDTNGEDCWCNPVVDKMDNGAKIIIHND